MQLNPFHKNFLTTDRGRRIKCMRRLQALKMFALYEVNASGECGRLCRKYGTDKVDLHNYASFYELIFKQSCKHIENVMECGIANKNRTSGVGPKDESTEDLGPSLRVWRDYFPAAEIVGVDIDSDMLFTDDRIKTYQMDQTDPKSIAKFKNRIGGVKFDVIIDDGLHKFHAAKCLFENMIDRLTDNGVYIIEDVSIQQMYYEYANYFGNDYSVTYISTDGIMRQGLVKINRK